MRRLKQWVIRKCFPHRLVIADTIEKVLNSQYYGVFNDEKDTVPFMCIAMRNAYWNESLITVLQLSQAKRHIEELIAPHKFLNGKLYKAGLCLNYKSEKPQPEWWANYVKYLRGEKHKPLWK